MCECESECFCVSVNIKKNDEKRTKKNEKRRKFKKKQRINQQQTLMMISFVVFRFSVNFSQIFSISLSLVFRWWLLYIYIEFDVRVYEEKKNDNDVDGYSVPYLRLRFSFPV